MANDQTTENDQTTCPLCNYPYYDQGKPCEICGADHFKVYGIPIGYVYPSEEKMVRRCVNVFLLLIILIVVGYLVVNAWLDDQIANLTAAWLNVWSG